MKIPKEIIIGESKYLIKKKSFFRIDPTNKDVVGQINYHSKTMKLKISKDERMNEENFFHEIAHGVLKELEYNFPKITKFRSNEAFIQEMGLVLRKTFLDLVKEQVKN